MKLVFTIDGISEEAIIAAAKHMSHGKVSELNEARKYIKNKFKASFVDTVLSTAIKCGYASDQLEAYRTAMKAAEEQEIKFSVSASVEDK